MTDPVTISRRKLAVMYREETEKELNTAMVRRDHAYRAFDRCDEEWKRAREAHARACLEVLKIDQEENT